MKNSDFYLKHSKEISECLLALRHIILESDKDMVETRKYMMPCFTINDKAIVYLWTDKKTKEPYILFVDGNKIEDPILEQGDRKRMKILRVDSSSDIPKENILIVLKKAISVPRK